MTQNATTYISTRGTAPELGFEDVLLTGLAEDGGLYVPKILPEISFKDFKGLGYVEAAQKLIGAFIGDVIGQGRLDDIIRQSYAGFDHPDIAPLVRLEDDLYIMEQFHGPTLAFKDFALQFLGRIFDEVLARKNRKVTIVGATSGDTGSAAIEGCRGRGNMEIFILHPHGRVSEVQRRQMTTVLDDNVHNIAIEGSFDDCQDLVKSMFGDSAFRQKIGMSAVNSINWARILAQIVYYFYAAAKCGSVSFCVPTGNFGNIYAGYLAKKLGAPIDRLIVATNKNDILTRFFKTGEMKTEAVVPSLSPSMDIQISSNFERLLFDLYDHNAARVSEAMQEFRKIGRFKIAPDMFALLKENFSAMRCNDEETLETIKNVRQKYGYLLDPHSATGVFAAQQSKERGRIISLATAHPAKFPDAVERAVGFRPELPEALSGLYTRDERFDVLPNDLDTVKNYVLKSRREP